MEAGPSDIPSHFFHLHPAADGSSDHLGVRDEIISDLLLADKGVRIGIRKFHAGKVLVPGRPVSNQGIPSFRAPALGDAPALEYEMSHSIFAEMLAHGHSRLAAADNKRIHFFD